MSQDEEGREIPQEKASQEIIGWRAWMNRISLEIPDAPKKKKGEATDQPPPVIGLDLMSLFFPQVWTGPVAKADQLPTPTNRHGIYASKERADLDAEGHIFVGQIALSGHVVEHERGYRAELGVVRELHFNQRALLEIMFQMLKTPGLPANLPHWEDVARFLGGADCVRRLGDMYHCDVHLTQTMTAKELENEIAKVKKYPASGPRE